MNAFTWVGDDATWEHILFKEHIFHPKTSPKFLCHVLLLFPASKGQKKLPEIIDLPRRIQREYLGSNGSFVEPSIPNVCFADKGLPFSHRITQIFTNFGESAANGFSKDWQSITTLFLGITDRMMLQHVGTTFKFIFKLWSLLVQSQDKFGF